VDDLIGMEWSETLGRIQVQPFTETPGPVHQLGADATPLEFLLLGLMLFIVGMVAGVVAACRAIQVNLQYC